MPDAKLRMSIMRCAGTMASSITIDLLPDPHRPETNQSSTIRKSDLGTRQRFSGVLRNTHCASSTPLENFQVPLTLIPSPVGSKSPDTKAEAVDERTSTLSAQYSP